MIVITVVLVTLKISFHGFVGILTHLRQSSLCILLIVASSQRIKLFLKLKDK